MIAKNITLTPLTEDDREEFIKDNQYAFKYGAMVECIFRQMSHVCTLK